MAKDAFDQFRDQILNSPGTALPKTQYQDIGNLFQGDYLARAAGAVGQEAGARADIAVEGQEVARRNRIEEIQQEKQRISDRLDPNKYAKVRKEDGGFDFFDPEGKKIDVKTYAIRTNSRVSDALADSENTDDITYLSDYKDLQELISAHANNDGTYIKDLVEKVKSQEGLSEQEKQAKIRLIQDSTPQSLMNAFRQYYSNIYGGPQYGKSGGSQFELTRQRFVPGLNYRRQNEAERLGIDEGEFSDEEE